MDRPTLRRRIEKFFSLTGWICTFTGAAILFLLLGHILIGAAAFLHNLALTGEVKRADWRFRSPVYDNYPQKIEYWTEFELAWDTRFEPYLHWKRKPFTGEHINVFKDGVRLTVGADRTAALESKKKIFMFGGSTMWGTGSPDKDTIASLLQSSMGSDYAVYNYGETAFVSTQELNYLLYHLARDHVPNAVIFYDGVNDGYAGAYSPAIPRDPHNLRMESEQNDTILGQLAWLYGRSNYSKLVKHAGAFLNRVLPSDEADDEASQSKWDRRIAADIVRNARGVVEVYEAHIKQVKALAKEYGFDAYFFWQPNFYSLTREARNQYERDILGSASPTMVESQRQVYMAAKDRLSSREDEGIYFLGNIFDDLDEAIYIDWHHVGPNGNAIVARQMQKALLEGGAAKSW